MNERNLVLFCLLVSKLEVLLSSPLKQQAVCLAAKYY